MMFSFLRELIIIPHMVYLRALYDAHRWRQKTKFPKLAQPLRFLHLSGGGCDLCYWETSALAREAFDLARHKLCFVTSPYDANFLILSGVNMRAISPWIRQKWEAMPDPKGLIAVGDCACGAGPFSSNYAVLGDVASLRLENITAKSIAIAGCPPSSKTILEGLVALTTAMER